MDFAPKNDVFQKPTESDNHLKAIYMKGHINGRTVSRILVDGGAIVNLMPYSLYKKLGGIGQRVHQDSYDCDGSWWRPTNGC